MSDPTLLHLGYVAAFGASAIVCIAVFSRTSSIDHDETRVGLQWLLRLTGAWSVSHVGYLAASGQSLQHLFYVVGLIVGIAAVGPWLYFCSAYTGRSLHRNARIRVGAVVTFLLISAIKVTNSFHGLYYVPEPAIEPFPHLMIHHEPLHWVTMGLAYALAFIGIFMLVERFIQVSANTTPLFALVGVTGLPVLLDIGATGSTNLLETTYSPIGVAIFAVGVLTIYLEEFRLIRLSGQRDEPVLALDQAGCIRDYNRGARDLFAGGLSVESLGRPLATVLPDVAEAMTEDPSVFERDEPATGTSRTYQVTSTRFEAGQVDLGQFISITDVTDREHYRRQLERQNERLERFASMVSHDLRNPLSVAQGYVEMAGEDAEPEHVDAIVDSLDRMETLIDDLLTLARQGQSITDTEGVSLRSLSHQAWKMTDTPEASLETDGECTFTADPDRFQQLLENLFRNAIEHGGEDVIVRVGPLEEAAGVFVADDGPGIPRESRDQVFESGFTTETDGTGFGLAIVGEIVRAHGWEISVTDSATGGARFEITFEEQTPSSDADRRIRQTVN
ncbi:ATP-binding protein [Halovivax gelatinilyticus]|uniref:sensor histidine kinase n=1 Tax=Halovivax gelatinilyticus TaxID=2961597 RepID=UPI0020CA531E|nr:ATP-binding protein [Halovivax gelatinilyticus]